MIPDWYERARRDANAFADAIYQSWIVEAALYAYIKLPLESEIAFLVGYNPQRLLPAPDAFPYTGRWSDSRSNPFEDLQKLCKSMLDTVYPDQMRMMLPTSKPPTRYEIEGGHFFMQDPGTFDLESEWLDFDRPTGRRLTPFVMPIGRMSYPRIRAPEHKIAVIPIASIDYGLTEARILAHMADRRIRGLVIDIDRPSGDMPGSAEYTAMLREAMTKQPPMMEFTDEHFQMKRKGKKGKPPKDYLKHGGFTDGRRYRK